MSFRSGDQRRLAPRKASVIRFTRLRTASCYYLTLTKAEVPMLLSRRTQEEAPQDQRGLTEAELSEVTGGTMCGREPGM